MVYFLARLALGRTSSRLGSYFPHHCLYDAALVCAWGVVYSRYGLTTQSLAPAVLSLAALVISVADFRFQVIPDRVIIPLAAIGLLLALVRPDFSVRQCLVGGASGLIGFYLLAESGRILLKKQALGGGDIKLLGALGLYVGWTGVVATAFIGAVLALLFLVARRLVRGTGWRTPVPFGPFLAYASVLWLLYGAPVWRLYMELL